VLTIYSAAVSVALRIDFTHGLIVTSAITSAGDFGEIARTAAEISPAAILSKLTQLACLSCVAIYYCGYISKISKHRCVKLRSVATNPVQVEKNLTSGSSADKSF